MRFFRVGLTSLAITVRSRGRTGKPFRTGGITAEIDAVNPAGPHAADVSVEDTGDAGRDLLPDVRRLLPWLLAAVAAGLTVESALRSPAGYDVAVQWGPLGRAVADGVPPYTTPASTDVKPPGTVWVAAVGAVIGDVRGAFTALAAVGNAGSVLVAAAVARRLVDDRAAVLAACLAVLAVEPLAFEQNKTIVGAAVLYGLVASSPRRAGLALGAAGAVVQYAAVGLVPVGYYWWAVERRSGVGRVVGWSALVVVVSFLPLALWGLDSVVAGAFYSVGVVGDYLAVEHVGTAKVGTGRALAEGVDAWWRGVEALWDAHDGVVLPAVIGAAVGYGSARNRTPVLARSLALAVLAFLPLLLVRTYRHYPGMFLPAVAVFGSLAVARTAHWSDRDDRTPSTGD
jgi:hypothetical protein